MQNNIKSLQSNQTLLIQQPYTLIAGTDYKKYDIDLKKISVQLQKLINDNNKIHSNTLVELSENEIIELIASGNSVFIVDLEQNLIGFSKIFYWGKNEFNKNIIEFGTWVVDPQYGGYGIGTKILFESIKLAKHKYSNLIIYAISANPKESKSKDIFQNKFKLQSFPGRPFPIIKRTKSEAVHFDITNLTSGQNLLQSL